MNIFSHVEKNIVESFVFLGLTPEHCANNKLVRAPVSTFNQAVNLSKLRPNLDAKYVFKSVYRIRIKDRIRDRSIRSTDQDQRAELEN